MPTYASVKTVSEKKKKGYSNIIAKRKAERKKWVNKFGHGYMRWFGGSLFFVDQNDHPTSFIEDSKELPSSGEAKGLVDVFAPKNVGFWSSSRSRQKYHAPKGVFYRKLRRARYSDGECCECGKYPNPPQLVQTVDAGLKRLIVCTRCGEVMKP